MKGKVEGKEPMAKDQYKKEEIKKQEVMTKPLHRMLPSMQLDTPTKHMHPFMLTILKRICQLVFNKFIYQIGLWNYFSITLKKGQKTLHSKITCLIRRRVQRTWRKDCHVSGIKRRDLKEGPNWSYWKSQLTYVQETTLKNQNTDPIFSNTRRTSITTYY